MRGSSEVLESLHPLCPPASDGLVRSSAPSQTIVDLCVERNLWPAMGTLGRHRVEQHIEIRQMIRNYEALYEQLLQEAAINAQSH